MQCSEVVSLPIDNLTFESLPKFDFLRQFLISIVRELILLLFLIYSWQIEEDIQYILFLYLQNKYVHLSMYLLSTSFRISHWWFKRKNQSKYLPHLTKFWCSEKLCKSHTYKLYTYTVTLNFFFKS